MRVSNWNPQKYDGEIIGISMKRLEKAAEEIRWQAILKLKMEIGKGKTTGISRPIYKKGKYAGAIWTARNFGDLIHTIRVVKKYGDEIGTIIGFSGTRNVRVYAGNYLVWWAKIFEYYRPFLRPALNASKKKIRTILENG